MNERQHRHPSDPITRRAALGLASAALLATLPLPEALAMEKAGAVRKLVGAAAAVTGETARALAVNAEVFVGDLVRTEAQSRLHLKLGQRTDLKLGALTQIRIDRYIADAGGELELIGGVIGFDRPGPRANRDIQIRGPYGLIAVRGTRFYAGVVDGRFGVFVAEGRVAVTAAGRRVEVGPNLGTTIDRPGAPPSPPRRWAPARIWATVQAVR